MANFWQHIINKGVDSKKFAKNCQNCQKSRQTAVNKRDSVVIVETTTKSIINRERVAPEDKK
jgi:hypothetical protein